MTSVRQTIHALGLASACVAGDRVSLTFSTDEGLVRLVLPYASFCEVGRAARDSNGQLFPSPQARSVLERLQADAVETAPKHERAAASAIPTARLKHGEALARCPAVYEALKANPFQHVEALCATHGIKSGNFYQWLSRNHPGGVTELRGNHERMPVAKPATPESAPAIAL